MSLNSESRNIVALVMKDFKVLVIGIDGASADIIFSLAKEGLLTNFTNLIENGCFGTLHSTTPPISSVAWSSLYTGSDPSKHKIFDFVQFKDGLITPHTSYSIRGRALWDILGAANKKSILINVPFTFPAYQINGIMISGFPSPRDKVESYPADLISSLKSEIGEYYMDVSVNLLEYRELDEERLMNEAILVGKKRAQAACHLVKNYEWDFFMVVFTMLDRIQHVLFGYATTDSRIYSEEKRLLLADCYKQMDSILGKIVSILDEDTILIVVSDHGFEPLYKYVAVNNLLAQGGFIKRRRRPTFLTQEWVTGLLRKMGMNLRYQGIPFPLRLVNMAQKVISPSISFQDSIAYSIYPSSVFVNRKKMRRREEYEDVKTKLIAFLRSIADEETGEKIVEKIYCRDEFSPEDDDIPDLSIIFKRGYQPCTYRATWVNYVDKPPKECRITGTHYGSSAQKGVFLAFGKGIRRCSRVDANITDVAPTILHIEEVPVPTYMDGQVLKEVFEANSRFHKKPLEYKEIELEKREKPSSLSGREKEDMKERLRALGYLA